MDNNQIITLNIKDNGIGFQSKIKQDHHYGLIIMRDRIEILNGNLVIDSKPNKGTQIVVTFKAMESTPLKIIEE